VNPAYRREHMVIEPHGSRKKLKQANAVGRRPWAPAVDRRDRC
jgi:hypothetical protein